MEEEKKRKHLTVIKLYQNVKAKRIVRRILKILIRRLLFVIKKSDLLISLSSNKIKSLGCKESSTIDNFMIY